MADISVVLGNIGLRKYVETFVREEITVEMLPMLTEDHLKQLGINTIGARLQFKNYIQALNDGNGTTSTNKLLHNGTANNKNNNGNIANHETNVHLVNLTTEVQALRGAIHSLSDAIHELIDKQINIPNVNQINYDEDSSDNSNLQNVN